MKDAPVQVNYLVYPGTTGAAFMDYVLADRTVLPLDQQPYFSEKIIPLNGHPHEARPGIFSHHPAPVQVNYLVYPGTTGASFMDYVLADRIVLPLDQQPYFSEKIIHLPGCYQANDATRIVPRAPSQAEAGLPGGAFVFC